MALWEVQLILIDDIALQSLDVTETADSDQVVRARHHQASTGRPQSRTGRVADRDERPTAPQSAVRPVHHPPRTDSLSKPQTPGTHMRRLTPRSQIRMLEVTTGGPNLMPVRCPMPRGK